MNVLGSGKQWDGWLKGTGSLSPIISNLINIIGGIVTAGVLILLVVRAIMLGVQASKLKDSDPAGASDLKKRAVYYVVGVVVIVVATAVVFALFNTIGKTVEEAVPATGTGTGHN